MWDLELDRTNMLTLKSMYKMNIVFSSPSSSYCRMRSTSTHIKFTLHTNGKGENIEYHVHDPNIIILFANLTSKLGQSWKILSGPMKLKLGMNTQESYSPPHLWVGTMIGENRQLVTDEPVRFEKYPVEVQDCMEYYPSF